MEIGLRITYYNVSSAPSLSGLDLTSLLHGGEVSAGHQVRIHGGPEGEDENGVPVFNHANPSDWLHKRAYYEKRVKEANKKD